MDIKDFETLKTEMINYMKAHSTSITDFNDGSNIVTIFEAIANIVEQAYIDTRIGYSNSLKQLATSIFGFSKKSGQNAGVDVVFSRSTADTTTVTIPSGTIISNGSLQFQTTSATTIDAGETDSASVSATAMDVGTDYNVSKNTITVIVSAIDSSVNAVTNPLMATGGADAETDDELLARFKTYINGLQGSNYYGIKAGILNFEKDGLTVRSVGIVEHTPVKTTTDGAYNVTVYIDDGTGTMSSTLKEYLTDLVNGDGTSTQPGLRALGINVELLPASQVPIYIKGTCIVYRKDESEASAEIQTTLTTFINSLEIGENVVLTDLIMKLRQLSYVTDVSELKIGLDTESYDIENIAIGQNQIARLGGIDIEVTTE